MTGFLSVSDDVKLRKGASGMGTKGMYPNGLARPC
jgi:hypothetical protein